MKLVRSDSCKVLYSLSLLNALETTDKVNNMLVAIVSYGMAVAEFQTETLKTMNGKLANTKMYGAHFQPNDTKRISGRAADTHLARRAQ